jgi:hypothetical protein
MEIRAGNLPRTCDRIDMSRPIRDLLRVDPLAEKKKPATQRLRVSPNERASEGFDDFSGAPRIWRLARYDRVRPSLNRYFMSVDLPEPAFPWIQKTPPGV